MEASQERILEYHRRGKVGVTPTKPLASIADLSMAYTPGVAVPARAIAENERAIREFTAKDNTVAVVTDGTAVLGLGDIGPRAAVPVMEGKAVLFKAFADVDAWPVPLDFCRIGGKRRGKSDPERVIETVSRLSCMYGGINLEDIAAPACFEIEDRLDGMLDIPVFHDDQWGTAVITLAAVLNYSLISGRSLPDMSIVINGAGAAGIRAADMLKAEGAASLVLCDSGGVVHDGRADLSELKRRHAARGPARTLSDAMRGAHVFIGVSVAGCLSCENVRAMAPFPAIFAMANPNPEILPEQVAGIMGGKPYVMATGRSDYPNQINNVLGFPFLFRGALDARASSINMEMKRAAARALAELAREPVPASLRALYREHSLSFGPGYIVPKPFDDRLLARVAFAVAEAAIRSGAGTGNPAECRARIEARAEKMRSARVCGEDGAAP